MKPIRFVGIFILFSLIGSPFSSVLAQISDIGQPFYSLDKSTYFRYPVGWVVEEYPEEYPIGQFFSLANSQEALARAKDSRLDKGDVFIEIIIGNDTLIEMGESIQSEILKTFPEAIVRDTFLGGRTATIISQDNFPVDNGFSIDIQIITLSLEDHTAILVATSSPGDLERFQEAIFGIAESLQVATAPTESDGFISTFEADDPNNDLWTQDTEDAVRQSQITDSLYNLKVLEPNTAFFRFARNRLSFTDAVIDMEIVNSEEMRSTVRSYGVIFRRQTAENFYLFEVFTDYHYGVWKLEDGTWESLIEESFPPIPEEYRPHEGEPINLRVSAQGHEFTVFINDHELTTVSDDTFSSGGVGIYLVSAEVDEAVLQVDRFSVSTEIPH